MAFWVNFESDVKIPPMFFVYSLNPNGVPCFGWKRTLFFFWGVDPSNMEDKKVPGLNR